MQKTRLKNMQVCILNSYFESFIFTCLRVFLISITTIHIISISIYILDIFTLLLLYTHMIFLFFYIVLLVMQMIYSDAFQQNHNLNT